MVRVIDQLREQQQELTSLIDKQQKRVHAQFERTYRHVSFFLIFQSLIFFSITRSTALTCGIWWVPFGISLLNSLFHILILPFVLNQHAKARYQLKMIHVEYEFVGRRISEILEGQENLGDREGVQPELNRDYQAVWYGELFSIFIMVCVVVASAVMLYACFSIPCRVDG